MSTLYHILKRIQASPVTAWVRRWSFGLRALAAREPRLWWVYRPYIWWDQKNITARGIAEAQERVVDARTELVIDGFPGSANSFATAAFQQSQRRPVALAHHMHSPVQIMQALALGKPVILTVRDPRGATLSLTSRWPHVTVAQGLRTYIHFYRKLLPEAGRVVISPFERTTLHFDDVIAETNQRFNTDFAIFDNTEANRKAIRKPEKFSTPAWKQRQENKKRKAEAFASKKCQRLLAEAEALHEAWLARARSHPLPVTKP